MPCAKSKVHPGGKLIPLSVVGEQGMLKLQQVSTERYDIYGEVTNQGYKFSIRQAIWVDVRDAAFMLGKDFELVE